MTPQQHTALRALYTGYYTEGKFMEAKGVKRAMRVLLGLEAERLNAAIAGHAAASAVLRTAETAKQKATWQAIAEHHREEYAAGLDSVD